MVDEGDSVIDAIFPDKVNFTERELHDIIEALNSKWASHVVKEFLDGGVEKLVEHWKEIVEEIDSDSYCCWEDFTNDFFTREIIEDIMDTASTKRKDRILKMIAPIDEIVRKRIKFVNLEVRKPYLSIQDDWVASHPKEKYWWYWGEFPDLDFKD